MLGKEVMTVEVNPFEVEVVKEEELEELAAKMGIMTDAEIVLWAIRCGDGLQAELI